MHGIYLVSGHTCVMGHLQLEESCSLSILPVKEKQAIDKMVKVLTVKVLFFSL